MESRKKNLTVLFRFKWESTDLVKLLIPSGLPGFIK